jgi:signal transduction histidine kinase
LLGEIGRAGLPVELHVDGKPFPLPRGVDLSAYRNGLVGVRERVKIYGGEITASTGPEGGFVLSTRLPILDHEP